MRVSVVIPNWNGLRWLGPCLDALDAQSYRDFETIVVDNGSTDGSVRFLSERRPPVRICALPENVGFAAGMNAGFRSAEGEYLVALNNDTVADAEWLEALVAAIDAAPAAGSAASTILSLSDPGVIDTLGDGYGWTGLSYKLAENRPAALAPKKPFEVFGACAAASIYRRRMLDEIGLFDESFFAYMEDVDLAIRARLAGWTCISAPGAVVLHAGAASSGGGPSEFSVRLSTKNIFAVILKNVPATLLPIFLASTLGIQAIAVVVSLATGRPRWLRRHLGAYFSGLGAAVLEAPRSLAKRRRIQSDPRLSAIDFATLISKSARLRRQLCRPDA